MLRLRTRGLVLLAAWLTVPWMTVGALAHCQIPCGIYDDELRVNLMEEHTTTIQKSVKEILRLSKEEPIDYNQLVRWVQNKEHHADEIMEIATQYFMAQRVKPAGEEDAEGRKKYVDLLTGLHDIQIKAMKCKQTADLKAVEDLREAVHAFRHLYLGEETH